MDDICQILANGGQILAGGQSLIPILKQRLAMPELIIDIGQVNELKKISKNGNILSIGAVCTHYQVANDPLVKEYFPALAYLAGNIGDMAVRNLGTIGGSLAYNDPSACYPSAILATKATIHIINANGEKRTTPAVDFFQGILQTTLGDGDIITQVDIPIPDNADYQKMRQPASRFAICGVFLAEYNGKFSLAVTGVGQNGVFCPVELQNALNNNQLDFDNIHINPDECLSDIHASGEFRAHLVKVLTKRAYKNITKGKK